MAASSSDLFQQVGTPGTATTLAGSGYTIGAAGITVASTTNWPTGTGVSFAIDRVDSSGVSIAGTYCEFVGVVTSGTAIGSLSLTYGTAQNYAAGATTRVYIPVSSTRENRIVQGITVQHNQDGTHGAVTATSISTGGLTATGTVSLPNNSISAANLATSAITLGYAQITADFSTGSTTAVQATGLSVTVTIPAGGRKIKITAFTRGLYNTSGAQRAEMTIWDGTVGSGTKLGEGWGYAAATNAAAGGIAMAVVTPSAGSKTYNVGLNANSSGTATIGAAATSPAFILVEAI